MYLMDGINPYPYALNEIKNDEYIILRNMRLELKKKEIEDERRKWKLMMME